MKDLNIEYLSLHFQEGESRFHLNIAFAFLALYKKTTFSYLSEIQLKVKAGQKYYYQRKSDVIVTTKKNMNPNKREASVF